MIIINKTFTTDPGCKCHNDFSTNKLLESKGPQVSSEELKNYYAKKDIKLSDYLLYSQDALVTTIGWI